MPVSVGMSLLIILAVALTTFATRVVPFLIFPKGKEIPPVIQYLGRVLTPAVIGLLVVYCLRQTPVMEAPHGIPEGIAVAVTALLHVWKRNKSSEHRRGHRVVYGVGAGSVLMVLSWFYHSLNTFCD